MPPAAAGEELAGALGQLGHLGQVFSVSRHPGHFRGRRWPTGQLGHLGQGVLVRRSCRLWSTAPGRDGPVRCTGREPGRRLDRHEACAGVFCAGFRTTLSWFGEGAIRVHHLNRTHYREGLLSEALWVSEQAYMLQA